jgi:hypothetical protein
MLAMTSAALPARTTDNGPPPARRLVLVPASGRGDELVRRYRLARMRLMGPETTPAASPARSRGG